MQPLQCAHLLTPMRNQRSIKEVPQILFTSCTELKSELYLGDREYNQNPNKIHVKLEICRSINHYSTRGYKRES